MSDDKPQWPENDDIVGIEELAEPLAKLVRACYNKKRKPPKLDYTGYDLPAYRTDILACAPNISQRFGDEELEYHQERGRDLIDVVIWSAINLGTEHGHRCRVKQDHCGFYMRRALRDLTELTERLIEYDFGEETESIVYRLKSVGNSLKQLNRFLHPWKQEAKADADE